VNPKRFLLILALVAAGGMASAVALQRPAAAGAASCSTIPGDANCDCVVDLSDVAQEAAHLNQRHGDAGYSPHFDLDGDGAVGLTDLAQVVSRLGTNCRTALGLQKGMTYVTWNQNGYQTTESDQSLSNLAATGANWVGLVVTGYQAKASSTSISRSLPFTPTDADLIHVVTRAHDLGMKVMLKPHVDLADDPDSWRGLIGFQTEEDWSSWFGSYRDFIGHYANLARTSGADAFTVGVELEATSKREADWRRVVSEVRQRFTGPITYAANPGEEAAIAWWDVLDYIGVDAYWGLTQSESPSVAEIRAAWQPHVASLASLSARFGKPVLFTEAGYRSIRGASVIAGDWKRGEGRAIDLQIQADAYEALFETFWDKPWFIGAYWWAWGIDPTEGGPSDSSYTPRRKPAEDVIRFWYGVHTMTYLPAVLNLRGFES